MEGTPSAPKKGKESKKTKKKNAGGDFVVYAEVRVPVSYFLSHASKVVETEQTVIWFDRINVPRSGKSKVKLSKICWLYKLKNNNKDKIYLK